MPRLKSRERFPPGEFQILLSQTGMEKPVRGSFAEVVTAFSRIVEANPSLAVKHGWPIGRAAQEDWVDAREAQRMLAHGWTGFVEDGDPASGEVRPARRGLRASARNVAEKVSSAAAIYADLFGPDGKTVPREQAEARAAVCVACPQNLQGGLGTYFVESLARSIMGVYGILNGKHLVTSHDSQLGTCETCSCPLRAKVWPAFAHIKAHLPQADWDALHPDCWMRSELAAER